MDDREDGKVCEPSLPPPPCPAAPVNLSPVSFPVLTRVDLPPCPVLPAVRFWRLLMARMPLRSVQLRLLRTNRR